MTRQPSVVRTGGGEGHGCLVAERTVPSAVVVVLLPGGDPPPSPTLTTMAADHELVLVCDYDVAASLIRAAHTL